MDQSMTLVQILKSLTFTLRVGTGPPSGASQELVAKKTPKSATPSVKQLLGTDRENWGSEAARNERERFDETLERLLSSLEPVVMACLLYTSPSPRD